MNRIELIRLNCTNFKGFIDLTINFAEEETQILGANGTGKTSVADAIFWVLFGKDSQGRTVFDIKTLNKEGEIIPNIPHRVELDLRFNDEEIRLSRTLSEQRDENGEFKKNVTDYAYNGCEVTAKDYQKKIAAICDEEIFRILTHPEYFHTLSSKSQFEILCAHVGQITDEEVIGDREMFQMLLNDGLSIEEKAKKASQQKKKVDKRITEIDTLLNECARQKRLYIQPDVASLCAERDSLNNEFNSILEESTTNSEDDSEILKMKILQSDISVLSANRENKYNALAKEEEDRFNKLKQDLRDVHIAYEDFKAQIKIKENKKVALENEIQLLRNQYRTTMATYEKYSETQFSETCCPVCGTAYSGDVLEENKKSFMNMRANTLASLSDELNEIVHKAELAKAELADLEENIIGQEMACEAWELRSKEQSDRILKFKSELPENSMCLITEEEDAKRKELDTLRRAREKAAFDPVNRKAIERSQNISKRLAEIEMLLERNKTIQELAMQIDSLQDEKRKLSDEKGEWEDLEFTIEEFRAEKVQLLEKRINEPFKLAQWKFYATSETGIQSETCECSYDGIPYSALNTAMKIAVGVDIINAFSKLTDICAPIIIDNRESVTEIPPTASQLISLIVSPKHLNLTVK